MLGSATSHFPEIMAPAGDFICLDAALRAGADSVYFGLKGSNMRAGAENFSVGDLRKIVAKCREFGAAACLTLNTIYYENELKGICKILDAAKRAGVSAVIAWDFAVVSAARERGIPVYLSTQASVSNSDSIAAYWKNFGIGHFVLARECSIESIRKIRLGLKRKLGADAAKIKFEAFAHGAMCVSLSGRCFMSEFLCGKSANRGECRQPCRREYLISDANGEGGEFVLGKGFVMSPKDLCTLGFLEKLLGAGVDSLKIEGRNRNAEYVSTVVGAYVKARNFWVENHRRANFSAEFSTLKKTLLRDLEKVFNRGFSDGFYMGIPISEWTSGGNSATMRKVIVGHIKNFYAKPSVAEVAIDVEGIRTGERIQIEGNSTGFVECFPEKIMNRGLAVEKCGKGDLITLEVPRKVRRGDRVYKLVCAHGTQNAANNLKAKG